MVTMNCGSMRMAVAEPSETLSCLEQFGLLLTCNINALVTIVLCDTIDEV